MTGDVVEAQACDGFAVSPDGSRFRLYFRLASEQSHVLELPVASLPGLMRFLPEIQQIALPQGRGDPALRVKREAVS
ncbi:MAG TPA: hypothetical protein VHB46_18730 [Burkholderiales bacterium]|nr:hypothetical protein [Burkholderiales bacterium]